MSALSVLPNKKTFELVSRQLAIQEAFVEKDWHVTQVIASIAGIQHDGFEVIFSGGTALSKAHGLLQRFSEDVDFRVIAPEKRQNRTALSSFKHAFIERLRGAGFRIEDSQVKARDSNRFFSIDIDYDTVFSPVDTLRPHIKIEVTARSIQLPPIYLPVASFVAEIAKQPVEVARIGCIDPVEIAADKLSALAWRIPDRIRGGEHDDASLVRHIHDLAILKDSAFAHESFTSLVSACMEHDDRRSKNNPSFAGLPMQEKFDQMLSILESDKQYSGEYDQFVKGVSYAPEKRIPDFDIGTEAIRELVARVAPT